jgi:hypothetical protein
MIGQDLASPRDEGEPIEATVLSIEQIPAPDCVEIRHKRLLACPEQKGTQRLFADAGATVLPDVPG